MPRKPSKPPDPLAPLKDFVRTGKLAEVRQWIADGNPIVYFEETTRQSVLEVAAGTGFHAMVEELRRLTAQSEFLRLGRVEQDGRAAAGGVYVVVQAGSTRKTVWCDSKFPEAVVKITDVVKGEILASREDAPAEAGKCTEAEVALVDQLSLSLRN